MINKIAVVTGSNKGIGYAIVKELCQRGVSIVYLAARDIKRGKDAVDRLNNEGFKPLFHQLEVTDENSIKTFAEHMKQNHGGIDILINNAAVAVKNLWKTTYEDAERVINVNYRSILLIQKHLFPILKDNARVINISSNCGHISNIRNTYWIERLTKDDIKVEDVDAFIDWFLDSVKNETLKDEDFAETTILSYRVSKVAISALTRVQQKDAGRGISINSLHPGFVQTDMTANVGELTIDEAGKTPVYLALDIEQSEKGKYFWFDRSEKDWSNPQLDLYAKFETLEKHLKLAGLM